MSSQAGVAGRHQRLSRGAIRVWMAANALVLIGFGAWILAPSATAPAPEDRVAPVSTPEPTQSAPPTKAEVLDLAGLRFGVSSPDVPWSSDRSRWLADQAGAAPTIIQFFVNWTQDYPPETVELSYRRGALPMVSWEPWAGSAHGTSQPDYALAKIAGGDFDAYIRSFAAAVRDHGWPIAIRLAHEMNGHWYPWSERRSGNQPGEFVQAWQHIHDVFEEVGATNVIWLWSPNILRSVPNVSLEALYPGDAYVDWVGMVGYAVTELTAAEVFDPTLESLREFTGRPVVITETGAQPGEGKVAWIEDFFGWVSAHPDVIGFVWFEYDRAQGASADWRFTASLESLQAFRDGIANARLAPPLGG